jgi:hypothetical protein
MIASMIMQFVYNLVVRLMQSFILFLVVFGMSLMLIPIFGITFGLLKKYFLE